MLIEYFPSCRQRKSSFKCNVVASMQQENIEKLDFHPMKGNDGKIYYIAQRRPWQQSQGIPPNPLSFNPSFPSTNQKIYAWNAPP
jgi:hypothetical protein